MDTRIPKVIHYCWFGLKEKPKLINKCIKSWREYFPEFEIFEWNESNFNYKEHPFARRAYEERKYAFVSDYARVILLEKYGGIYFDTDVEVINHFDPLWFKYPAFGSFETSTTVQTGVLAFTGGHTILKEMIKFYDTIDLSQSNFSFFNYVNSKILSEILCKHGLELNGRFQKISSIVVFPASVMCPVSQETREIILANDTVCIHYLKGSWMSPKDKFTKYLKGNLGSLVGYNSVKYVRDIYLKLLCKYRD